MKCGNYNSSYLVRTKDRHLIKPLLSDCTDLFCQVRQYVRDLRTRRMGRLGRDDHGRTMDYSSPKIGVGGAEIPLRITERVLRVTQHGTIPHLGSRM